jgi:hypothetical protein
MRHLSLAAIVLLSIGPVGAYGANRHQQARPSVTVVAKSTGEIKALSLKRITVGSLSCALGAPVAGLDRFVISDPVSITCRSGKLAAIKYAPPRPPTTGAAAGPSAPAQSPAPSSSAAASTLNAVTTITQGSSAPGVTSRAQGPVVALGPEGITVGDVTCPLTAFVFEQLSTRLRVGDVASLSCTRRENAPSTMYVVWSSKPTSGS